MMDGGFKGNFIFTPLIISRHFSALRIPLLVTNSTSQKQKFEYFRSTGECVYVTYNMLYRVELQKRQTIGVHMIQQLEIDRQDSKIKMLRLQYTIVGDLNF